MSRARPGRLLARWVKRGFDGESGNDFRFDYPRVKSDAAFLYWLLFCQKDENGRSLIQQLEVRGYDITTLRIQVDLKTPTTTYQIGRAHV